MRSSSRRTVLVPATQGISVLLGRRCFLAPKSGISSLDSQILVKGSVTYFLNPTWKFSAHGLQIPPGPQVGPPLALEEMPPLLGLGSLALHAHTGASGAAHCCQHVPQYHHPYTVVTTGRHAPDMLEDGALFLSPERRDKLPLSSLSRI